MEAYDVVIGTVFMDCKGFAAADYDPAGRNVGTVKFIHGGVGRNVAENLANLGESVLFVSSVDDTALGSEVEQKLKARGVDLSCIKRLPTAGMGIWLVIIDENGNLAGSVSQMPRLEALEATICDKGDEIIKNARSVLLELDLNEKIAARTIALAEKYGKAVYGITGNMQVILKAPELLKKLECYICNETEAERLFGSPIPESTDEIIKVLAAYLTEKELKSMIITLGERGSVWCRSVGERTEQGFCPVEAVRAVDTTGAGDAFFSGAITALNKALSMQEACLCGTKLALWTLAVEEPVCHELPEELFR